MKNSYYTIPKCGLSVLLAAALMLCGAVVRIVYYTGVGASAGELWIQERCRCAQDFSSPSCSLPPAMTGSIAPLFPY